MASEPAKPRAAATVILLRRGGKPGAPGRTGAPGREAEDAPLEGAEDAPLEDVGRGVEVLLARRNPGASFMPGVWVFPGGAVAEADGADLAGSADSVPDAAYRACALRELAEEVGISLAGPDELVPYSRWITPEPVPVRFDTRFYAALAPAHSPPRPDGAETIAADWFAPEAALGRHRAGELSLVFPTIRHLESLTGFASAEEVLAAARERKIVPILPRVVVVDGERRVVLPGDPGY